MIRIMQLCILCIHILDRHPSRLYSICTAHTHACEHFQTAPRLTTVIILSHASSFIVIAYYICRYLATGPSFRALAFSFRVGLTTVGKIVAEAVIALWEELYEEHMLVPTKESFKLIAEGFYSIWNFPNCLGSIDGKHVHV